MRVEIQNVTTYIVESMYLLPAGILQICSSFLQITGTAAGKHTCIVIGQVT